MPRKKEPAFAILRFDESDLVLEPHELVIVTQPTRFVSIAD